MKAVFMLRPSEHKFLRGDSVPEEKYGYWNLNEKL